MSLNPGSVDTSSVSCLESYLLSSRDTGQVCRVVARAAPTLCAIVLTGETRGFPELDPETTWTRWSG